MVLNWIRLNVAFDPQQELQVPVWELTKTTGTGTGNSTGNMGGTGVNRLTMWVNEIVRRAR